MEIHSNSPKLYYGFNIDAFNLSKLVMHEITLIEQIKDSII